MSLEVFPGSDLNRVSSTITKYLEERALKPGELIKYRLLNGVKNIDRMRNPGDDLLFPSSIGFSLHGKIFDPGDPGKNNGRVVEIGAVRNYDERTRQFAFVKFKHSPTKGDGGEFMIRGSVMEEMAIYDAIELSNFNGSNPYRDVSVDPIFERINEAKESTARSTRRNALFDSLAVIRSWDLTEMRIVAAGYNINPGLTIEVLRDKLEGIAEKDPTSFIASLDSEDLRIKALIKMAKDADIITWVPHESRWMFTGTGENVAVLNRREGVTEVDQLCEFIKTAANGRQVKANIEKMIAGKRKKETV